VGELKLFPKIRELTAFAPESTSHKPEDEAVRTKQKQIGFGEGGEGVISSGAACRMQIRQGTDVEAIHPILLVADLVNEWRANDKRQ
jgi:hypothetical protein